MDHVIAVIIPTRDRSEAIERYAMAGLERSSFRDFVCVVWDASEDELTRCVIDDHRWGFEVHYFKALRKGLASQRNDAVKHVITTLPGIRYIVFIDDDSELSEDALAGVTESFKESCVQIVNIRAKPMNPFSFRCKTALALKRIFGMNRHGVTSFLYNYGGEDEPAGCEAEWAGGGGMGVSVSLFRDMGVFFPEEFQRFGGYALGEDLAFSFYVSKVLGGRVITSLYGHYLHYAVGSQRLDIKNMAASKWYNFHLLFDVIYGEIGQDKAPKMRFNLFMLAAALKLLVRARSLDILSILHGISEAHYAYRQHRSKSDIRSLMRAQMEE